MIRRPQKDLRSSKPRYDAAICIHRPRGGGGLEMHRSDCVASLLLVAFGLLALFVVIPSQVADAEAIGLPPRGMPIFTAAAVTFLSGLLLIKSLLFSARAGAAPFDLRQLLAMLTGLVIAIAGTVLFAFAGFVASGLFVIVALMLFID